MDSLAQLGVFLAEALIILFVILLTVGGIAVIIALAATKGKHSDNFEIELLDKKFRENALLIKDQIFTKIELKEEKKKQKELEKQEAKESSKGEKAKKRLFVIDFDGDIKASQAENLREEITAVLSVARPEDEVVIRLESPGGVVHGYGLAASQLSRVREKGIALTVCVDQVAASGGYLMSCVANKILAAPFAIVGSIGVVAQVPNFNRVLKKYDIDYKEYTAGDFKRTVSILGEITEKGERKFLEQLEETHILFKSFVSKYRPQLNIAQVASGEYWYGQRALELSLVDEITTSDDYLLKHSEKAQIIKISFEKKKSLQEKISQAIGSGVSAAWLKFLTLLEGQKHV